MDLMTQAAVLPSLSAMAGVSTLADAGAMTLVSPWKPVLLLLPFIPWAWFISKVMDKHAARFFLPRENWNLVHLCVGLVAFLVAVLIPVEGEGGIWAGFGAMIFLLGADIAIFVMLHNKDERVPAEHRITMDMSKFTEAREAKAAAKLQGKVSLVLKGPDKSTLAPPTAETPEYEIRVAAEQVYLKAMQSRASQIDFAPVPNAKDGSYGVTALVDGVRQSLEQIPAANAQKMMDLWKTAAKLDINERRKKQVADVTVEQELDKKKLRLTSIGAQGGMRLTILVDPEGSVRRKVKELGLLEPQMEELKKIVEDGSGVVVLTAPADAGRTTTFYSVVKMHDAYTTNVQTIEVDQQDSLEGAKQNIWDPQAEGPEFSTLVRSILRRDPQVLGVAELPDVNTAKEIAKADHERTRIYVSLRADNTMQGLAQWIKAVGDYESAGKPLHGAVGQKLVRKLCNNCKVGYSPTPEMVKKLGLPADRVKQLFKKGGQVLIKNKPELCPVCGGGGYIGQEGIYEVYFFTNEDRALLRAGDLKGLQTELRKRNLPTMQVAALRKAVDGITSVEEIMRVTAEGQAGASGGGGAGKPADPKPSNPQPAATAPKAG